MSASYFNTAGTFIVDVNPLESNGPGNLSTPRQIVDVEFLDKSFVTPTDAFVVNDDVSTRFVQGFSFTVVDSPYAGAYTVDAGAFAPGATVCQVVGGQTHVPVADIVSTSVPYNFFAGFTTPLISPTTPHNYLVTWQLDGNVTANFSTNDVIQVKRVSYNGDVISRSFTVVSATYSGLGYTNVVTELADPSNITPVLGVSAQSVVVTPYPANAPFGYVQYTVSASATSLMLVGKGAPLFNKNTSWGNAMQANMIHMMEHFAHTSPPVSPMNGQMWFDTTPGPTAGPALNLYSGATWYGVVAEGLPVQGNINMNNFKIANVTNATTTFPYVASSTGWGNNDQEVMNLGTSDALYIAKTGGYNADPLARSGTMTGDLYMQTNNINFNALFLNEGNGDSINVGPDIRATVQLMLAAQTNLVATVDYDNDGTGDFIVSKGALTTSANTPLMTVYNSGEVRANTVSYETLVVNNNTLINKKYADDKFVDAAGDSMSGTLAMTGSANITLADGDVIMGTGNNTLSILRNGSAASTIVFNTTGASTTIGNNVINLGTNMITGLSTPVNASDATNKAYVDSYVSGIIWLRPVLDPSIFNDTLSSPPADDGFTEYHRTYIVAGVGTGAWAGYNGHLMAYDGTTWQSVLGRAVQVGDRFGVFCSPDNDDPLSTLPGGGLVGHAGKIAEVTGVSPYTYTFYTPAEPDAFSVIGVSGYTPYQSPHMGQSYTFRGQYGVGTYGSTYGWIVFSGPQMIVDGAGLRYDANVLNTDGNLLSLYNLSTNGFVVRTAANTVDARTISGTTGNITVTNGDGVTAPGPTINLAAVTQGSTGTSFVKVALDGYGRVTSNVAVGTSDVVAALGYTPLNKAGDNLTAGDLTLFQDPTAAMHASTKQYVDAGDQVGYEYFVVNTEINVLGAVTPGYGYVAGSYTNVPLTGGIGTGATADITVTASAIDALNTLVGGSLYTNGSYTNVPLTGGTGTGATADITVAGGTVTVVTIVDHGVGYTVADVLSANSANIGGTGSGFSINVASVSGAVTAVTIINRGVGYTASDSLSASNTNLGGTGTGFGILVSTTRAQTVYTLTNFTYVVGSHKLMVFVNGTKEIAPLNGNYTETSTSSFTFAPGSLTVGGKIEAYKI